MSTSFRAGRVWGSAHTRSAARFAGVFAVAGASALASCAKVHSDNPGTGADGPPGGSGGASGSGLAQSGANSSGGTGATAVAGRAAGGANAGAGAGTSEPAHTAGASAQGGSASIAGASAQGGYTATGNASLFPLSVASNHRYLQDANGTPFPILGDSAWEVTRNTDYAGQRVYVEDRVARGFNSVLVSALGHKFTLKKPPRDAAGNLPFSKRLDGQAYSGSPNGTNSESGNTLQFDADPYQDVNTESPDFTYPAQAYWAQQDGFISDSASSGVAVFLVPAYTGSAGGDEGWMNEMVANDAITGAGGFATQPWADATKSKLWNYGAWLAQHYAAAPNIVWVLGGDFGTGNNAFSADQARAVSNLFAGMKSVPGQQSKLWTARWARPSFATDVAEFAPLLDLQAVYTDDDAANETRTGYAAAPVMPTFEIGAFDEGDPAGFGEPNRRYQWWAYLGSIAGHFSGNSALWHFPSNWQTLLDSGGAQDMKNMNAIIRSIRWHTLVPSGLGGMKQIVTANGGSPGNSNYVACAGSSSAVFCYVPPGRPVGSFTIDSSVLSAPYRARWYAMRSLSSSTASNLIPNSGTHTFTPADAPFDFASDTSFTDAVLVLDVP